MLGENLMEGAWFLKAPINRTHLLVDGIYYIQICKTKEHMWQSRVEIESYSVAYFDHIAAFKAPYR